MLVSNQDWSKSETIGGLILSLILLAFIVLSFIFWR